MKKFIEVFGRSRKIGWEMEACYELERAAENAEGQMVLVLNDGMFNNNVETYEVGISMYATGDFKNHPELTKDEATKIFESYLE